MNTHSARFSHPAGVPNQPDQIATGRAVIDAIQDAANRLVFRELLDESLEPWSGARAAFVSGSPTGQHGVDTTDTLKLGIASFKAHTECLAGLGNNAGRDPAVMLERMARKTGLVVTYAGGFEVVSFNPPRPPTYRGEPMT
jgi:hypothetical protein